MADFEFPVHRMTPKAPEYNIVSTKMEGWRIKRRWKSSLPIREWSIEIRGRTNTEKNLILAHYTLQIGSYIPFNWIVPTFFGGQTYYVTYKEFDYDNPDGLGNVWDFHIVFREELP